MKQQKGYIFPFTVVISFLFILVLFHQIEAYAVEQKFIKEREELEDIQSLFQVAFVDIIHEIMDIPILTESYQGSKSYPNGKVTYKVIPMLNKHVQISLSCRTKNDRKYHVLILYDTENNKVVKWIEG